MGDVNPNATMNATPSMGTPPAPQPTQDSDLSSQQIQAPTPAPAPQGNQVLQLAPSSQTPPSPVPTSKNPQLHRLVGSFLGALAGPAPVQYQTDASGKMTPLPAAPESAASKARRIAAAALGGLSAGSQVGPQKSGLAALAAGAGAGAESQMQKQKQQDLQARAQSKEEFEREQQARMQKMEIARGNALTLNAFREGRKLDLDMDPQRQAGLAVANAAKDANIPGAEVIPFSEWQARLAKDSALTTEYVHMPAGFSAPTIDKDGNPVEGEGQIFIMPATKGGEIALPQSYVEQAAKYGPYSGRFSSEEIKKLQAGNSIPVEQFASLNHAVAEGRLAWVEGEHNPKLGWTGDDKNPVPVLYNSVDGKPVQHMPAGVTPDQAVEASDKRKATEAETKLKGAQTQEAIGKTRQALAEAELAARTLAGGNIPTDKDTLDNLMKAYNNLPPLAQGFLKNIQNPSDQATLLSTWAGRTDPKSLPTSVRKGSGQMTRQQYESMITRFDPTWTESKYEEVKKLDEEYQDPKRAGGSISSFGQFLRHAAKAKELSDNYNRMNSRFLDTPLNELRTKFKDDSSVVDLAVAVTGGRDEWQTIINNGHEGGKEEKSAIAVLANENSTPRQIAGAFKIMGEQGVSRLDELDQRYKTLTGTGYPNILSPKARAAAEALGLKDEIADFNTGGSVFTGASVHTPSQQSGQNPPANQGGIQVTDPKGGTHTFPDQASADKFKAQFGIK